MDRIYRTVKIDERLPNKTGWYIFISLPYGLQVKRILFNPEINNKNWILQRFAGVSEIEWLEEKTGLIVFTPQELRLFILEYDRAIMNDTVNLFLQSKGLL